MKGTFILSIDVELAWGFLECVLIGDKELASVRGARSALRPLLKLLEDYEVPVTWFIVGHVFLDRCECVNGRPHPDMPRPRYSWFIGDWYRYDPCTNLSKDPAWYGADIVSEIMRHKRNTCVRNDICPHTFSHPVLGDPGCTEEVARREIEKCLEIMSRLSIKPRAFAFPLNDIGYVELLKDYGFTAFRGRVPYASRWPLGIDPFNKLRRSIHKGLVFFRCVKSVPIVFPRKVLPGLYEIPSSACFAGPPRFLEILASSIKRGIKNLTAKKGILHVYTHLHNFGLNKDHVLSIFEDILCTVFRKSVRGEIQMASVEEVAEKLIRKL